MDGLAGTKTEREEEGLDDMLKLEGSGDVSSAKWYNAGFDWREFEDEEVGGEGEEADENKFEGLGRDRLGTPDVDWLDHEELDALEREYMKSAPPKEESVASIEEREDKTVEVRPFFGGTGTT